MPVYALCNNVTKAAIQIKLLFLLLLLMHRAGAAQMIIELSGLGFLPLLSTGLKG